MNLDKIRSHWLNYKWKNEGNEWGNGQKAWEDQIYLRLSHLIPTNNILEIATGMGRITKYAIQYANTYIGYDISTACVTHCKEKFKEHNCQFYETNGTSLPETSSNSIDVIFSYDSFILFDRDTLEKLLSECLRVLKPGGYALIHHSDGNEPNMLIWRGQHTAKDVHTVATNNKGIILYQERWSRINHNSKHDCFSLIHKPIEC